LRQPEAALADVEIITTRVERRRKWTAQEKAALLAERKRPVSSVAPGDLTRPAILRRRGVLVEFER
jgi:hypothetical protein